MRVQLILALCALSVVFSGCGGPQMQTSLSSTNSYDSITQAQWQALSTKKIFFGHQSVGYNIMEGVSELAQKTKGLSLNIVETRDPGVCGAPVFAHSRVGNNEDPESKCRDFKSAIDGGIGNKVEYAFFKFCFVDVTAKTDIRHVFAEYKKVLDDLSERYPKTRFIAMTVPLTYQKTGIKTWVKSIIGKRDIWEYDDNVRRWEFNHMLRHEFANSPLFDLAAFESTHQSGIRESFNRSGNTYFAMSPEHTADGGHLNARGRIVVAKSLLAFLASL
jgi:hypothetical protein